MDASLETYWQGIHADLREVFGPAGGDVVVTADEADVLLRAGVTTAAAALEVGAGNGLEPVKISETDTLIRLDSLEISESEWRILPSF